MVIQPATGYSFMILIKLTAVLIKVLKFFPKSLKQI